MGAGGLTRHKIKIIMSNKNQKDRSWGKKVLLQVDIFPDQMTDLKEITATTGKPKAEQVRDALDDYLTKNKKK